MNEQERIEILERAKTFFRENIVDNHIRNCKKAAAIKDYNINPFLFKYLAKFLCGNDSSQSIAKALIYPRILGSSITTSFGMNVQKLISTLFQGFGSTTQGIDIEFFDAIDSRKKYCQLKAGPNTINRDDVTTICNHFNGIKNLARTNHLTISLEDLIVGVIYGNSEQLSSHYLEINKTYPVIIGQEFWYRLTGKEDFYYDLIRAISDIALEIDGTHLLQETIEQLSKEIEENL